jgi:hypothetical protein
MATGIYIRTKPVWNKGKTGIYSEEARLRMSQNMKGRKAWNAGKTLSEEHRQKLSLARMGKRPWNYKGGVSPLYSRVRSSVAYKKWRRAVFIRDGFTCQECGQVGGELNADHYPLSFAYLLRTYGILTYTEALGCKPLWDIKNGRTLCISCHEKTPNYKGRANRQ